MTTYTLSPPIILPAGEIIATGIPADAYMAQYAEFHHEWVKGAVIKMTPVSLRHTRLTQYLLHLLSTYFSFRPVGMVLGAPFVMRLETTNSYREPDLQVILKGNPGKLTDTAMLGPADICIEVVSPESATRDYGDKFIEYEEAGVQEYWLIDPLRQRCDFNRRSEAGVYAAIAPDEQDSYRTPLLPGLAVHVPTLWQDELPNMVEIVRQVQAIIEGKE